MKPLPACDDPDDKRSKKQQPREIKHPPAEDELGGGDICSLEETPSTEDDQPLP